jgi:hypothetical protein
MSTAYSRILNEYSNGTDLMKAILENAAKFYFLVTEVMLFQSREFKKIETHEGYQTAKELLAESLIILRRQLKYGKITLMVSDGKILIEKYKNEFFDHLDQLLSLLSDIRISDRENKIADVFDSKLINGQAFRQIQKLKGAVTRSLFSFGCTNDVEKEEIYNECLVIFWQKLMKKEIGYYIRGRSDKPESYHVFNRQFYQNSKLSTFLIGIAKNIFLNRIKTVKRTETMTDDLSSVEAENYQINPSENSLVSMFLYFRAFIEPRKLRSVISILQYDCNLEDKDVRQLLGINNARIHSCRLRSNFHEWYGNNRNNTHLIFDKATGYLSGRTFKTGKLNDKFRTITTYIETPMKWKIDLGIFREEFRSLDDFVKFHRVFRFLIYFSYCGKPSAMAGSPDEKSMREMLEAFKKILFSIPEYQTLLFLFYYGSEEPEKTIVSYLQNLSRELMDLGQNPEPASFLSAQLEKNSPVDESDLQNKIYETNCNLFSHCFAVKELITKIITNEPGQRAF